MNKDRRKRIDQIIAKIEDVSQLVEEIKSEKQNAFDNLPEIMQESEKGENMEKAIYDLEQAYENLEFVISLLHDAKEV